jgi:hypothetical protein
VSGENIVWIVGYRMSDYYKLTEGSKRVLRAEYLDYP